jgi:hypothetical protein
MANMSGFRRFLVDAKRATYAAADRNFFLPESNIDQKTMTYIAGDWRSAYAVLTSTFPALRHNLEWVLSFP